MAKNIFNKILVPYDDSNFSKKAVEHAIEICKKHNSTLFFITVINLSYIRPPGSLLGLASSSKKSVKHFLNASRSDAKKALEIQVKRCKEKKINAYSNIKTGNISEQILKFANAKKITLIILGSQGLHGFGTLKMLGSTSRKVSELARCPVLIIR